jgi:hypothetical protein
MGHGTTDTIPRIRKTPHSTSSDATHAAMDEFQRLIQDMRVDMYGSNFVMGLYLTKSHWTPMPFLIERYITEGYDIRQDIHEGMVFDVSIPNPHYYY